MFPQPQRRLTITRAFLKFDDYTIETEDATVTGVAVQDDYNTQMYLPAGIDSSMEKDDIKDAVTLVVDATDADFEVWGGYQDGDKINSIKDELDSEGTDYDVVGKSVSIKKNGVTNYIKESDGKATGFTLDAIGAK